MLWLLFLLLPDVPRRRRFPRNQQNLLQKSARNRRLLSAALQVLRALKRYNAGTTATPASSPLKEIYFQFDRYDLNTDARETLKTNAGWLRSNPSSRIEIEGHCDERGTNEYNLALGAKRAQAAKDYLVSLGIPAERVSTISYGEEIPVCKEQNESCWQKNRRARFVILPARPTT